MEKDYPKGLPNLEVCYIVSHMYNVIICIYEGTKHPILFKDSKCIKQPHAIINLKFIDEIYLSLYNFFDMPDNMTSKTTELNTWNEVMNISSHSNFCGDL